MHAMHSNGPLHQVRREGEEERHSWRIGVGFLQDYDFMGERSRFVDYAAHQEIGAALV